MATVQRKDKITAVIKLILDAGKATPAYPVGPTLGGYGINLGALVREYNDKTAQQAGMQVPAEVTIFGDRSFNLRIMEPTTPSLLRRHAGIVKGSSMPGRQAAGRITRRQLREVAVQKLPELNAGDIETAMQIIAGTARNMGIEVDGFDAKAQRRKHL